MVRLWSLRRCAAASTVLLGYQAALAFPQLNEVVPLPVSAWVSVDDTGAAVTINPIVRTTNGATTTISPPPANLMATGTYTLLPSGLVTTRTGLAPVATATGAHDSGAFLACTRYKGPGGAICQPEPGTVLYVGQTYYVTWSPSHFSDSSTPLTLLITFSSSASEALGRTAGSSVPASVGYYPWTVPPDLLSSQNTTSIVATLSLQQSDTSTPSDDDAILVPGPEVYILPSPTPPPSLTPSSPPSAIAIAVPVVIAFILLLLAAACFFAWRRTGRVPVLGGLVGGRGRRSSGYGVRKSAAERVGARGSGGGGFGWPSDKAAGAPRVDIQLTDRESWSPTGTGGGRNVFREEVRRQEEMRR